jgi:hypothetical protein
LERPLEAGFTISHCTLPGPPRDFRFPKSVLT